MKYSIPAAFVALALAGSACAGTISGKVSGAKGQSVIYVETAAGKTFPAPAQHVEQDIVPIRKLRRFGHARKSGIFSVAHNASTFWRSRMTVQRSPSTMAIGAAGRAL